MSAIIPPARTQFLDSLGRPLVGGAVYTFAQGTTTPKSTYKDRAQTQSNTNPITLDSAGTAAMWGVGAYTMVVQNSIGATVWSGDSAADNYDPTAVAMTGGTIDGVAIGQTAPAAGKFTTLTITGGIDGTPLGLATPAQAAFTSVTTTGAVNIGGTLTVVGQITTPNAIADTSAVARGQVKAMPPLSAVTALTGTAASATTASLTAPCAGILTIDVNATAGTINLINSIAATASLAGLVVQSSGYAGTAARAYAYLTMAAGDTVTVTGTVGASASASLVVFVRAIFQPAP